MTDHLTALIQSLHNQAQKLLNARILLKADASDGGEGWSDSQIAAALESRVDTVARTRQRLVEEGFEAALIRKHSPNSARRRIFDGGAVLLMMTSRVAFSGYTSHIARGAWILMS